VLEDPPGEQPVILAYKMNGDWLASKRGGPVRLVVPDGYGFKSIKWLQRVVLTNDPNPNDTYAGQNNDVDSPMKTFARFLRRRRSSRRASRLPSRAWPRWACRG
jgi:DMSO/TMAO reductase YedYZ molybdopterin-dependent catalytic subunit